MLHLLPDDVMSLIVRFVMTACPGLLGLQRTYGIVGTRIVIRDEKIYRKNNTPPTPVVKRAVMALWSRVAHASANQTIQFTLRTMGTARSVLYTCDLRGLVQGAPYPTHLNHLDIL
jgi:hypothetical protein